MGSEADHHIQVVEQFSLQAEGYAKLTRTVMRNARQAFVTVIRPSAEDVVLEVCCGPGLIALELAPCVAHATGLDLTPAMLANARAEQTSRGVTNVDWRQGDVCALPFAEGSYSLVLCNAAFHHLQRPRIALEEMVRVCRSGGRVVVRDVTPDPNKSQAYDSIEKLRDPSHTHALTPLEMAQLGIGLSVGEPEFIRDEAADLPLDPILGASFPRTCTVENIRALIRDDALSGQDRLGLKAKERDGRLLVSYSLSTVIWTKL